MNGTIALSKLALVTAVVAAVMGFGFVSVPTAAGPGKPAAKADPKGGDEPKAEAKDRTIAGKVLGADGRPVAAELFLLRPKGSPESLGRANADGSFKVTISLKDAGDYLVAKADGHGIDFMMPAANTPADVTFKLPKDNPIRGQVIDTQGKPVAGATVTPLDLFDFTGGTADAFLTEWKTRHLHSGVPGARNAMRLDHETGFALPDGRMLLAAKSGADGHFEISGVGAERVVNLFVRGPGIGDTEVYVVNRDKFDPSLVNRAAADNRERMLLKGAGKPGRAVPLHGPTPAVIAEQERVIRGVVKDRDTGKPRADVEVVFLRVGDYELLAPGHRAKTDKDGRFELRGSRKHEAYVIETYGDPDTGYLPCQVEAKDTAGYEPIAVEIGCAKGVIVSGKVTDKETGKPLAGNVFAVPLHDNEFVKKYPTMDRSASAMARQNFVRADGTFRVVTVPGRVLLMAGTNRIETQFLYMPPQPDPKFPQYFHHDFGTLGAYTGGAGSPVHGNWCRVLEIKGTDTTVVQDIELEPATRTAVRIVDAEDKPVAGCEVTGLGWKSWVMLRQETDTATAYGIGPKEERLIAAGHVKRGLVGTAVVQAADKNPVVTLGPGGTAAGRVVDEAGQPVEGVIVRPHFEKQEVAEVYARLNPAGQVVTNGKGEFRLGTLPPGFQFRLTYSKGKKNLGPESGRAPRYQIEKHGESKDLGDQKVQTTPGEE